MSLGAAASVLFRNRKTDALYGPGYAPLVPAGTGKAGLATTLVQVKADWTPHPNWSISAAYVHGFAGDVIRDAGGTDTRFLLFESSFRF